MLSSPAMNVSLKYMVDICIVEILYLYIVLRNISELDIITSLYSSGGIYV